MNYLINDCLEQVHSCSQKLNWYPIDLVQYSIKYICHIYIICIIYYMHNAICGELVNMDCPLSYRQAYNIRWFRCSLVTVLLLIGWTITIVHSAVVVTVNSGSSTNLGSAGKQVPADVQVLVTGMFVCELQLPVSTFSCQQDHAYNIVKFIKMH